MQNFLNFNFKSIVQSKARWLLTLIAILTLGVGQMWADNGDFYNMYIAYSFEGVGGAIDGDDNNTGVTVDAGTLTSGSLTLTGVYLKCWDDWGSNYKSSGGQLCYTNKGGSTQYISCTRSGKSGNNYEYQNSNPGVTLASYNQASGSFEFHCWGQTWGWGDRYFPKSSGHYVLKYKIAPPAVSSISVSPSNKISGTGTSEDPFIIAYGSSSTLTVTATKHHTDANSSLKVKFGSDSYSGTNTKSVTPDGTKRSITIYCKYNNSTASLDGEASSTTVYYIQQTPGITVVAGDNGKVRKSTGDSWASSATISPVAASTAYNIYANPDTHYDFKNWTTDDGTHSSFADAESASTTVTLSAGYSAVTTVTANFKEHPYTITIVGGTASSTTAGISTTKGTATVSVPFGKRFTGWTVPGSNFTLTDGTTTSSTTIKFNATAAGTVTANFAQNYAFIEGRMTVCSFNRGSETHIGDSKGAWKTNSTNVGMEYDGTNHRFFRHTYKRPDELQAKQGNEYQWFYVTVSQADGSLSNTTDYHPSGSNGEFTAAGYTNKIAAPTTAGTYNFRINASTNDGYAIIYFDESYVWYELEHSFKYHGNGNTSGNVPAARTYYNNGATVTVLGNTNASPLVKTGYNFSKWNTAEDGGGTNYVADNTFSISTNTTLYAQWTPKTCTVSLDFDEENAGFGDDTGATTSVTGTFDAAMPTIASANLPKANAGYAFMGFYDATGGGGTKYYNADGSSARNWDKDTESGTTLYAYYKKAEFTTLEHNATVAKGDVITLDVNPVLNVTPVEYTAICWTLHYSENDNEVPTSGDHYYSVSANPAVGKPAQVRFTMTNLAVGSYYVKAVLKTSASSSFDPCSTGTLLDTETSDFRIVGSSAVTINYQYYVTGDVIASSGSVEIEAESNADITAPEIIGYSFREWSLGVGVTKNSGELTDATINISSTYDGVVTAFYNKKQMIYFNNTLGWDDVYVYFYNTSKEYWANDYGTGANKQQYFNGQYPFGNGYYGHMTHIEGTDVWYFDYQAASIPTLTKVAFANKEQVYDKSPATNDEAYFHDASVVYRTDFDASHLSMFVPIDAVKYDYTTNTGSKYYHGYWINYPENTGYKLMIFDRKGDGALFVKDQDFTHNANKRMPMSISLELEGGKTYGFKVYRDDVKWYGNGGTMKNGNSGDEGQTVWEFTTGTTNCGLTTTSSGIYTFTLSYGQDNYSNYNFLMGVRYPESVGDFRVQYKDDVNSTWKTSVVIPAVTESDTVSYFVRKASTPYIRVQKCTAVDGSGNPTWTNQSSGDNIISSLPSEITADGVYNFIFKKADGVLVLDEVEPYTGNFYIRVGADGDLPWDNYRVSSQIMPFSEYSFNQTTNPYSHYFTKYYRTMNDNGTAADPSSINVTFVVANDYSTNISDTITTDDTGTSYVNASGMLSGNNANIRFMYNYKTNVATRRYLDDAQGPRATDFLLLIPSNTSSIYDAETGGSGKSQVQLSDKGNWVYEANVWVVPGTEYQVKATFGKVTSIVQYLKGAAEGDHQYETLIGGEGSSRLQIRLLYDFKTNRIIAAYLPSGTIDENLEIDADIMFVREHQGNVTQITFGENKSISEIHNVYSVLRFNKSTINDYALSRYERDLFYVSFPYNVLVSDIIGFGTYGTHWIIEYYDGADRAAKGFWKDSKSFWKFVTPAMASSYTLQAGTGYIVALDLDEMDNYSTIWANTSTVELIFPGDISSISNQEVTYNMPIHQCNIGPRWEGASDRRIKDSHWNILGVPTYHNTTGSFANHTDEIGEKEQVWSADGKPRYLYTWNMTDNSLTVTDATDYNYKAMHAYVVQYYGDVTFHTSTNAVPSIVARRTYAEAPREVTFRMEIQQNDQMVDHTFVTLSNDETVSNEFVFGEDMSKEFNANKANIYTMVTSILNDTATVTEVAGNTLPMSNQTMVVPVGVTIKTAGDYTFAIPDGTSGVGVTLVDTETGIRTSLSALSYTVNLTAGTHDGRFFLEIAPIQQTPTGMEEVTGDGLEVTGARKVIIDQKMYIIRDGKMYDARGAMIK